MAKQYTAESLSKLTDVELRRERAYLEEMLVVWEYLTEPLPDTIRGYLELGDDRLTRIFLGRYKRLRQIIKGCNGVLDLIDEELRLRGAL